MFFVVRNGVVVATNTNSTIAHQKFSDELHGDKKFKHLSLIHQYTVEKDGQSQTYNREVLAMTGTGNSR